MNGKDAQEAAKALTNAILTWRDGPDDAASLLSVEGLVTVQDSC
jgi:hypothetical protein